MSSTTRGLPGFLRRSLRLTTTTTTTTTSPSSTTTRDNDDDDVDNNDDNSIDDDDEEGEEDELAVVAVAVVATNDNNNSDADENNNSKNNNNNNTKASSHSTTTTTTTTVGGEGNDHSYDTFGQSQQEVIHPSIILTSPPLTTFSDTVVVTVVPRNQNGNNNNNDGNNNIRMKAKKKKTSSYREQQYDKILNMDIIQMYELRELSWNGIPYQYRSIVWKLLLGYIPTNVSRRTITIQRKRKEYCDAIIQYYNENDDNDDEEDDEQEEEETVEVNDPIQQNKKKSNNKKIPTRIMMSHHRTVQEQETLRQVLVDVPRTQPNIILFRNHRIQLAISRILYIWAIRHPASSYVQGINDLVTPFITIFLADYYIHNNNINSNSNSNDNNNNSSSNDTTTFSTNAATTNSTDDNDGDDDNQQQQQLLQQVLDGHVMNHCSDERLLEVEADTYWCLTNLLYSIQDHYTNDQPGLQRMVQRLEELVHRIDKDLTVHIRDDIGIQFLQFSFKWMNCLLLREFHLKCIFRLWDTYLSEKNGFEDFHVYVCAAFMCQFSHQLQTMTFDELFGFMQDIPTNDWTDTEIEVLLSQAYVLSTLFKGSDAHLTNNSSTGSM